MRALEIYIYHNLLQYLLELLLCSYLKIQQGPPMWKYDHHVTVWTNTHYRCFSASAFVNNA